MTRERSKERKVSTNKIRRFYVYGIKLGIIFIF
jgi:hypothetical protein